MRQTILSIIFGLVCSLLAVGVLFLITRPPVGSPVSLLPPPEPAPIIIHVSGAVTQPGVYTLPADSRVQNALDAAGGLLPEADATALNLAAPLEDGTHIGIPARKPAGVPIPTAAKPSAGQTNPPEAAMPAPGESEPAAVGMINLNAASLEELDSLPGIGPAIAQRIIDYRTANGLFLTIEDLQNVKGIGPATFEKLKDLITVGP